MRSFLLVLFSLSLGSLMAQNTVGLLSYDGTQSYQGYTLIYPHNQANVYLLDNCGEIVHVWEDDIDFRPGNTAYLREDGSLVKTKRDKNATASNPIWAGGGGAIVEIVSWDNDQIASFELNNEEARLHHDIAPMSNGNVLMIAWEKKTREEAIAAGRDTSLLVENEVWPEMILEWNPTIDSIVWEWHAWDHLVQDFDPTKNNFGVDSMNIRKINLNYDTNDGTADWLHANSLDYNEELDQIMISIPQFDEIWIIDHSTTTEEAATSLGGNSKHGGDLIYRFGNLQTYGKGTVDDQLLFFQHDAHWSNQFIEETHPDFGKVVVFNNRVGEDFSSIEKFTAPWSMYDTDYEVFQDKFPPFDLTNTVTHPDPTPFAFHSTGLSSAQLLPNGNLLACSGRQGYIVELTPSNDIVWEYITPLVAGNPATQGDVLSLNNNLTFRAFRYPLDYVAFDGRDLSSKGFIELEPDSTWCDRLLPNEELVTIPSALYPNPANGMVHLSWETGQVIDIEIVDLLGRTRLRTTGNGGMKFLDVSNLENNMYFVRLNDITTKKLLIAR